VRGQCARERRKRGREGERGVEGAWKRGRVGACASACA
jgi:hypothetical protein